MMNKDQIKALIDNAPGAAPWYLRNLNSNFKWNGQSVVWVEAGKEGELAGKFCLKTSKTNELLLVVGMYTICYPISELNAILFIRTIVHEKAFEIILVFINNLSPIKSDVVEACGNIERNTSGFYSANGPENAKRISLEIDDGMNKVEFGGDFLKLDEFSFVTSTPTKKASSLTIFIVNPKEGRVEKYPQDWFNNGDYDFGYQWITRATKSQVDNRIYGDGIRLGVFKLDESGRQLEEWLLNDLFHGPGSLKPVTVWQKIDQFWEKSLHRN